MEKGLEFFDAWVRSQKEFIETGLKSQKEFMTNWTESIQNLQASFLNLGGFQEGPGKEMLNLFNPWFNTMANSTRVFSDEVVKKNGDIDIEEREQVAKRHDSETSVKSFHRGGKKSGRSGIVA